MRLFAERVTTDVHGNVVACVNPGAAVRVMLAGHCDEIGFMVRYIDDHGFLYFAPIGGVDAHLVPGQRVCVHTASGPVLGVIGKKPIHMMEPKDRETVVKFKNMFIDIGCPDRKSAAELVAIGDPATFAVGLERLQGDRVISRAFDDKMGAYLVARTLIEVRRRGPALVDLFGVSTVLGPLVGGWLVLALVALFGLRAAAQAPPRPGEPPELRARELQVELASSDSIYLELDPRSLTAGWFEAIADAAIATSSNSKPNPPCPSSTTMPNTPSSASACQILSAISPRASSSGSTRFVSRCDSRHERRVSRMAI